MAAITATISATPSVQASLERVRLAKWQPIEDRRQRCASCQHARASYWAYCQRQRVKSTESAIAEGL